MPDTSVHPLRNALTKFWAPVPWLLEASIVLEVVLHKYSEAAIIAGLLVFNAALAYFQESHAQATLKALKSRLALNASVQRDGKWKTVVAAKLVRGDLVKLSVGSVVAADVRLVEGSASSPFLQRSSLWANSNWDSEWKRCKLFLLLLSSMAAKPRFTPYEHVATCGDSARPYGWYRLQWLTFLLYRRWPYAGSP
jgi:hypothetical protein